MTTTPLSLAEAVPLGTVYLQRLLTDAGIRSLVIKGPAFVVLGVRKPKQSNDVDLLIEPDGQGRAHAALAQAGWTVISPWVPRQLDDVVHSKTYSHPQFPVTVDVHHAFSGLLASGRAFDAVWRSRDYALVAHCSVETPSVEHALVIEALNRIKDTAMDDWLRVSTDVVDNCRIALDVTRMRVAVEDLAATESADSLLVALGDESRLRSPSKEFIRWSRDCGRHERYMNVAVILRRAPWNLPKFLWKQVWLDHTQGKKWATARGIAYEGRSHVLQLRCAQLARKVLRRVRGS